MTSLESCAYHWSNTHSRPSLYWYKCELGTNFLFQSSVIGFKVYHLAICSLFVSSALFPFILSFLTSFKCILSDMRIATSAFFWYLFAWNIFFHLLTFSLYMSLGLKWVSCRQHIYRSCSCIHSASLCLLVGAFNPFTFKVIIDMYDPITIFLIILGLLL